MDLMTKLGGRKFLMALIVLGVAVYLETRSEKGLSATMAGFMVAVVSAFSVVNYASSAAFMQNKKPAAPDTGLHDKIDGLTEKMDEGFSPERTEDLRNLLISINEGVSQNKALSGQIGQTLLNLGQKRG